MPEPRRCELCHRRVPVTTVHHLFPKTLHRNKKIRACYDGGWLRAQTVDLCKPCHKQLHALISEKEMASHYHTIPRLLLHPEVARFVEWVRDRPGDTTVPVRRRGRH